ncbi:unnamed protein product, partial [Prorocentrum cordatum]
GRGHPAPAREIHADIRKFLRVLLLRLSLRRVELSPPTGGPRGAGAARRGSLRPLGVLGGATRRRGVAAPSGLPMAAAHGEACQALLREELGDSDPRLCDAGPMSLPRRALGLVLTRSFVLSTPGGQSSVAMLPLLDLLNHADGDGVRTPRRTCFCVQEGGSVLMVAERDISPGEEVTHAYSEAASDHGLLCQYGVAPPADGDAAGGRGEAGLFDGPKPSTFRSAWDIWGAPDTASPSRDRGIASPFSAGGQRNGPAD